jgi:hypothetical protein
MQPRMRARTPTSLRAPWTERSGVIVCALLALAIAGPAANAQTFALPTPPETEVSNDEGNALEVEGTVTVGNSQPIDVTSRFPNTAYTRSIRITTFGGAPTSERVGELVIPVASHLRGITLSASANDQPGTPDLPRSCIAELRYPDDPALRPANQTDRRIVAAELAPGFGTTHIPLYEMFVGKNVTLEVRVAQSEGLNLSCVVRASLHLRPIPGSLQPD